MLEKASIYQARLAIPDRKLDTTIMAKSSLFEESKQLFEQPATGPQIESSPGSFRIVNGVSCAGVHLLIDLIGASRLDEPNHVDDVLRKCAEASCTTLLQLHIHQFEKGGGLSGIAHLAESHIAIHTWPEHRYAGVDMFTCGLVTPHAIVPILRDAFNPTSMKIAEFLRGQAVSG